MEKAKSNEVSITKVSVKKPEDIKSFAESTMNELLGWYGYDSSNHDSKVPRNCRSLSGSNDSESESVKFSEGCGWCGKAVDENTSVISATAVFCSELCFSQSRRASFKRNKTCDWCRHTRHTISYVDFQDNAAQLQFCSDKCLNQYKMHIFCRETQAHLELHPHLHEKESTAVGGLITPELWLKNCTSSKVFKTSPSTSPKLNEISSHNKEKNNAIFLPETVPLITVAPSTKLLATDVKRNRTKNIKRFKKGCPSTITSICPTTTTDFHDIPQDLRIRQTPPADDPMETFNIKLSPKQENTDGSRVSFDESSDFQKQSSSDVTNSMQPKIATNNVRTILDSILPPPTTFVPYPVILPLPIPIPIPIPIPKMFKSNNGKDMIELKDCATQTYLINNNSEEDIEKRETEVFVANKRLLRKRKQVETKSKVFLKHKKTLSTLP